jgi:6-phosphofructokinase
VINQSLVGVVLEARRHQGIERVYGARHGVRGIVNEDFVDLTQETSHNLELVAGTPASALGSTRDKPDLKPTARRSSRCCARTSIEHFFYIGGNDSSDTVRIVAERGAQGRLPAALHPHPQDHRQRPGGQRPHAGLPVGRALRGPGLRRRQPRQRGAARASTSAW